MIFGFFAILGRTADGVRVGPDVFSIIIFFYLNYPGVRNAFMEHELSLMTPEQRAAVEQMQAAQVAMAQASTAPARPPPRLRHQRPSPPPAARRRRRELAGPRGPVSDRARRPHREGRSAQAGRAFRVSPVTRRSPVEHRRHDPPARHIRDDERGRRGRPRAPASGDHVERDQRGHEDERERRAG